MQLDNREATLSHATAAAIAAKGWTVLPHPAYSPDLAPSDFHIFGPLKDYLRGQRFEDDDDSAGKLLGLPQRDDRGGRRAPGSTCSIWRPASPARSIMSIRAVTRDRHEGRGRAGHRAFVKHRHSPCDGRGRRRDRRPAPPGLSGGRRGAGSSSASASMATWSSPWWRTTRRPALSPAWLRSAGWTWR